MGSFTICWQRAGSEIGQDPSRARAVLLFWGMGRVVTVVRGAEDERKLTDPTAAATE
jgi:hypothetical protein